MILFQIEVVLIKGPIRPSKIPVGNMKNEISLNNGENMKTLRILFTLTTILNCISGIKAMEVHNFDTVVKMEVNSTSDTENNSNYDTCGKRELTEEEAKIIATNLEKALKNVNVQELPIGKATRTTKPSIVHKVYNTSFYNKPTQNSTHGLKDVITVLDTTKPVVVLDSNNTIDTNNENISSRESTIKLNSTYAHELLNNLNATESSEVLNKTSNIAPAPSNAKIWEIKEKRNPNKYVNGYSDELMSDLNQFLNSVETSNNKNRYTKFFIGGIALGVLTTSIVALIKYVNKINNEFKSIIMKQKGLSNNAAELICNKTSFREKIKSIKQYNSAMHAHA